ncbi:dihydrolipoyl dehydrogenase family protein [Levilactobacillus yonginensis]|uniref:dihydrolipoyl dehydrogenase family protein n=1 Tax=Levilactobacillus yonginensis TaxID=1054041 RepID=UPI000F76924A|nr:NAD(P)/FAD-dependent oxidoreductase [Levilactobacillus yonginensis]
MSNKFDYVVLGSGPAAYGLTTALKTSGSAKTALIIDNELFGGTCPNYGCEPKIFLEGAVRNVLIARQLQGRGIQHPAKIDWPTLMATKQATFAPYPANAQAAFQTDYVTTLQGTASFVDAHTVAVNGEHYQGEKIIIATGLKAHQLPITGSELTHNSNDVLALKTLPQRVTFIGGGYVSMELATVLNAAGADVEIIEHSPRALGPFYDQHVAVVVAQMEARGIKLHFGQSVDAVRQMTGGLAVSTAEGDTYHADYVVDATGRMPNVDSLNLAAAGVSADTQGIIVDDHLQTNVAGIYAAGDVVKKAGEVAPKLTPVAQFEGAYLAGDLAKPIAYPVTGTGSFTFPQIAQVGVAVTTAQTDDRYHLKKMALAPDFAYAGTNDQDAELIGVFDQSNRLVGASEVSQTATDDVNQLVSVIALGLTARDFQEKQIMIFPTLGTKLKDFLA